MRRELRALGLAVALAGGVALAAPAEAQSATGGVSVRILQAITVTKTFDLNFGRVVAGTTSGTVAIAEDGTRTCAAALRCLGGTSAGAFAVTGTAGEVVTVSVDTPSITLTNGAGATMAVTLASTTRTLTLTGGNGSFRVSGTLTVGARQTGGDYTGQFTVSVNYQ